MALGNAQRISTVVLPGERGSIFDRSGQELAISIPQTTIWANPHLVTDPMQEADALGPGARPQIRAPCRPSCPPTPQFVYLARKVDDATAAAVKGLKLAGIFSLQEAKRFLPDGDLAAPLLGAVGTDNTGLSGLEAQYDKVLSGRSGKLIEEHDPAGSQIAGGLHEYQAPARGQDLVLTIDQSLQYATEQALSAEIVAAKAKGGMALLMDSKTGELRAVANLVMPPAPAGPRLRRRRRPPRRRHRSPRPSRRRRPPPSPMCTNPARSTNWSPSPPPSNRGRSRRTSTFLSPTR